jgi:hypothetical protein
MTLFSYTIPIDDGAAPNPFRGLCTLAICKPGIRRVAKIGDWVARLGSTRAPSGDLSGRLVYAMRIEDVLTLEEYDRRAPIDWPDRIPKLNSLDLTDRLGDCIYDYSSRVPRQRAGVHGVANQDTDLSGLNVLVSRDFYYFGRSAIPLPEDLLPICHQTQGHRSRSNDPYMTRFVSWIRGLGLAPGKLYGSPDFAVDWSENAACSGCAARSVDGKFDPDC